METKKPLEFHATAGAYFILTIISMILAYIPIFGWALLVNYSGDWVAKRTIVNGRKIGFKADYIETLKFVFVGSLLLIITFGIYSFWFVPKMYTYVADHVYYEDAPVAAANPVMTAAVPVDAVDPTQPSAPVPPVPPTAG